MTQCDLTINILRYSRRRADAATAAQCKVPFEDTSVAAPAAQRKVYFEDIIDAAAAVQQRVDKRASDDSYHASKEFSNKLSQLELNK